MIRSLKRNDKKVFKKKKKKTLKRLLPKPLLLLLCALFFTPSSDLHVFPAIVPHRKGSVFYSEIIFILFRC